MRNFAIASFALLVTLAACTSGGKLSIGANAAANSSGDGGKCAPFIEPPLSPDFCDGHYDATYDEDGCKVGYHCIDAGAALACPEIPPSAPNCTAPETAVLSFDEATDCPVESVCGRIVTEADQGQSIMVTKPLTTVVVRLRTNVSGKWTPDPKAIQFLGKPHEDVLTIGGELFAELTFSNVAETSIPSPLNVPFQYAEPGQPSKSFDFDLITPGL